MMTFHATGDKLREGGEGGEGGGEGGEGGREEGEEGGGEGERKERGEKERQELGEDVCKDCNRNLLTAVLNICGVLWGQFGCDRKTWATGG